ncbi:orotate phosphoribosyltransferase [Tulasnella sp. 418]|nr:orotate phosphoribosyltransferase [Tulasnella sp. 418]
MPEFDVLFGPAYKGITLAGATALCLHRDHNISVSYAFNRKEAKTHGEGGWVVGAPLNGKRVLILDDVITAGTAIREAVDGIRKEGGKVVGVVVCLDREEVGPNEGTTSAVQDVETNVLNGEGPVKAVVRMRDLMKWLENEGLTTELESMKNYWNRYGVKGN